jgi:hypothetical protein
MMSTNVHLADAEGQPRRRLLLPELCSNRDRAPGTVRFSAIVLATAIDLVMLWPVVRLINRLKRRIVT